MTVLAPEHVDDLRKSGLTDETIAAAGIRSLSELERRKELGSLAERVTSAYVIPYEGCDSFPRYKLFPPVETKSNGTIRYYQPHGSGCHLYVPKAIADVVTNPTIELWITEGEKKALAAIQARLACVALAGLWNWISEGKPIQDLDRWDWCDRSVVLAPDGDVWTRGELLQPVYALGKELEDRGSKVVVSKLPAALKLDDFLCASSVDELQKLPKLRLKHAVFSKAATWWKGWIVRQEEKHSKRPVIAQATSKPRSLAETLAVFRRYLHLKDPVPIYAVAGALVANRAEGDPVWLLLVCAPSSGKTEILSAATSLPWVIQAAKVTEASLLSGTSRRDRAKDSTGGLLRQVGSFGVLLSKDFTSVLSQNQDARAEALAALREVYDGSWHRPVGTDGGRVLSWKGKCGFVGGVTPALDQYSQVLSSLGDRFILLRMTDLPVGAAGLAALGHSEGERQMRAELAEALAGLVEGADTGLVRAPADHDQRNRLVALAAYTARARTAVGRDRNHEITYAPQVEGPGRLVKVYSRMLGGLLAIGCDRAEAWRTLTRIARDSVPGLRTRFIRELVDHWSGRLRTSELAQAAGTATRTAARHLEDLSLLGLAERTKENEASNSPDLWQATEWLQKFWPWEEESTTAKYPPDLGLNIPPDESAESAEISPVLCGRTLADGWDQA